jgi:L-amino acid N-acyltransferase YncA
MDPVIRLARPSDGEAIHAIYAPIVADSAISFEVGVPSADEMARRVAATMPSHPWLVVDQDGEVVAYAYGSQHGDRAAYGWSVDVSVYVRPDHHRKGLGRALYTALLEILRLQGFTAAFAGITLPNPGSVGIHEAVGFVPVGVYRNVGWKNGSWHDVGWWQHQLRFPDADGAPGPLRTLDDLTATELAEAIPNA